MENQTQPSAQNEPAVVKFGDPKEVLIAARKLIEKPEGWCKGSYRRGDAFCSDGALLEITHVRKCGTNHYWDAYDQLFRATKDVGVVMFNDAPERTHAEVLAAFDRAIELCGTVTVTTPAEKAAST